MKAARLWLTWFIFGTGITCNENLNNRHDQHSPTFQVSDGSELGAENTLTFNRSVCGRTVANSTIDSRFGTAPWNVGVYKYNDDEDVYEMICGGSLIGTNLVVSAAHCFWEENGASINNGTYRISAGKYRRDILARDSEHTQTTDVRSIYVSEYYNGSFGLHAADIAVLVLENDVNFSDIVAPVCVDRNDTYANAIPNGSPGKLVGWGIMENRRPSPFLLEIFLPFINRTTCRDMYTNGFQHFVTDDKFCAGSILAGQRATEGYSGAGLTYVHDDSHYLTGVVSVSDPWTDNSVVVFTNVSYHGRWIADLYANYTQRRV